MVKASAVLVLLLVAGATAPARAGDVPYTPPPPVLPSPEAAPPDANPWSGLTIGSEVFGISGRGLKSHVGGGGFAEWSRYYPDGSFVAFSGGAGFSPAFCPTGWATGYDFTTLGIRAGQDFGRVKTFMVGGLELAKPSVGPAGAPNALGSIDNVFSAPSRLRARGSIGAGVDYQVTDKLMFEVCGLGLAGTWTFRPPGALSRAVALSAPRPIPLPARRAQLASRALAAAIAPVEAPASIAEVAAVALLDDQRDERFAAEFLREAPGGGLVDVHQRRENLDRPVEAERERARGRFDRRLAAIRIAGIIGLAHAADERRNTAAIGERRGEGEKEDVSARHEGVGQAVR